MKAADRNFQGIWIPKRIYLNREVNWYAKILFLEIHSFTQHGKECYMSNKYISTFLKISERQVSRYVTELKTVGWITEISFDGRRRFLKSTLEFSFRKGEPATTKVSRQHGQSYRGSHDKNVQYIKQGTKQDIKPITSLKGKIGNRTPILE
ncbi:MAG: hypothetical protein ACI9SG_001210 [Maribacter sp.]|jgi:hypothetical protein